MSARPQVTILGGGFAGLEAAFYLRHRLGDRVDLRLVSDRDHFQFKPNTIYIPFGDDPQRFQTGREDALRARRARARIVQGFPLDGEAVHEFPRQDRVEMSAATEGPQRLDVSGLVSVRTARSEAFDGSGEPGSPEILFVATGGRA